MKFPSVRILAASLGTFIVVFVLLTLLADMLNAALDPRLRTQ